MAKISRATPYQGARCRAAAGAASRTTGTGRWTVRGPTGNAHRGGAVLAIAIGVNARSRNHKQRRRAQSALFIQYPSLSRCAAPLPSAPAWAHAPASGACARPGLKEIVQGVG